MKVEFAPTAFAQEVAALYRGGYQKGVSVGFRPLRFEERRHPQTGKFLGIRFTEQALLEVSAAPVPANENAVRRGENAVRRGYWQSALPLAASQQEASGGIERRLDALERQLQQLQGNGGPEHMPQLLEALREARAGP